MTHGLPTCTDTHTHGHSKPRGQDRGALLCEMSEANYVLGHLYFVEQARKSGLYRSGRMTALAPQEIWRVCDIARAGIGVGALIAMYER